MVAAPIKKCPVMLVRTSAVKVAEAETEPPTFSSCSAMLASSDPPNKQQADRHIAGAA